jgi:ribulose-5-phosphate 4-epimerase/fuculose-1-phosphate aldolase
MLMKMEHQTSIFRADADKIQVAVNAAGVQIHSTIHKAGPSIHAAYHAHDIPGRA